MAVFSRNSLTVLPFYDPENEQLFPAPENALKTRCYLKLLPISFLKPE